MLGVGNINSQLFSHKLKLICKEGLKVAFFNAIQGVLTIFLLIAVGYFLSFKGWFDDKSRVLISKMVTTVALPSYMISNLLTTYTKDKLISLAGGLIVPVFTMLLGLVIAYVISKSLKIQQGRRGIFCTMFAFSNTIFVGLPVNLALFGQESTPFVLIYYIANTSLFWTIGTFIISRDGGFDSKLFSKETLKRIFSAPLNGFIVAVILIMLNISLPKSLMEGFKYLGGLTTPLSMIFIGIVMYSVEFKELKIDKSIVVVMLGRFAFSPLVALGLCLLLPIPTLMKNVFVIQAAMPVMTQTSIVAQAYNGDYKYAAIVTTLSTIGSLVMIPVYMLILG